MSGSVCLISFRVVDLPFLIACRLRVMEPYVFADVGLFLWPTWYDPARRVVPGYHLMTFPSDDDVGCGMGAVCAGFAVWHAYALAVWPG